MDQKEVGKLLNYVKAAYPFFLKDNDAQVIFELWNDILKDYDAAEVMANFKEYAKGNKYPPTVSELISYAPKAKYPGHHKADQTIDKMQQFKKERVEPKQIDIREFLRG